MDNWDEIRTAFHVARLGTVSGAADVLGVHHATVIRHIDALEKRLGARLFQRHARGYTPTEAGRDLLQVAQATDDQFAQLAGRLRGQGGEVSGELTVTSVALLSPWLTPVLASFQALHPGLVVRFLTDERVFRLEYGEAHVALRAGSAPEEPDNVVRPFARIRQGLYAARSYADRHGLPQSEAELATHDFVGFDGPPKAHFLRWLHDRVPADRIVWRGTDLRVLPHAVRAGVGIGFVQVSEAARDPDLVEALPRLPEWDSQVWLVTHVDLHRTPKVQAFLTHLRDHVTGLDEV